MIPGPAEAEPELGQPVLTHRADGLARGLNVDDVQRRLAHGEWQVVRRGVYARSPEIASLTPDQLHRLRIEAALPRLDDRSVVSHLSAACLHGLDLLRPPGRVVQVTRPGARSGHRRPQLQTYCATLDPDEITTVDGFRVSSLARTIVDLARACGFEQAVVATDHALRTGRVERPALTAAADRAGRRKGIRTAHQVHRLRRRRRRKRGRVPQPRSDDPRGRAPAGTAVPGARAHRRRRRPHGLSLARVNTVSEFDGAQKYGRSLRPGQSAGDALFREKVREDRIRELGFHVVRWTWGELEDPGALAGRIRRALAQSRTRAG